MVTNLYNPTFKMNFQVSMSDELKHRLIHILVSGDLSHSEVMEHMDRDCEKTEIKVEDILHEIADLVTSKKDTTKKIYQLKSSVQEAGINPFFYFYTRNQRDEVDAATFTTTDTFNKPPVAKWPKLKPLFKRLPRLTRSAPMMVVINSVLQR